ncbi:amidohydrolase family protein [Acuticoccus yangtzensis]|uniref:amidohydrolase family protein n=1 Tax=Acuticoccus yangtzensis TaxID=1443441 RepID=UPI000A5E34CF|nr:amidohydrolase family protein [Acuticoccus yangtzensis]
MTHDAAAAPPGDDAAHGAAPDRTAQDPATRDGGAQQGAHRIDAHCHLWRLARGDYGWLTGEDSGDALAPIRRDFELADLAAVTRRAGIHRAVAVQAAPTVEETYFLLRFARETPLVAGVVGWADLSAPDAAATIAALAADPALKGLRPMLQDLPEDDWITRRPTAAALAAMKAAALRFDALVMPRHLAPLLRFLTAHPDLPAIIDHAAKPALAAPPGDPRHALWRAGMAALGRETGARVKLSGLLTEMPPVTSAAEAAALLRPLLADLLEWFGPSRIVWGSDWPVLTLAAPYALWDETTTLLLADLSPDNRAAIQGANAARFYGLEDAP